MKIPKGKKDWLNAVAIMILLTRMGTCMTLGIIVGYVFRLFLS